MPEIVVRLPGPTERGFLRRVQEASVFRDRIEANDWKAMLDFADYLIAHSYVEVPDSALEGVEPVKDADGRVIEAPRVVVAKQALYDLSRDEFLVMLFELAAGSAKAVDPPKGA